MPKVLTADLENDTTQATIRNMESNLDAYFGMMECEPLVDRLLSVTIDISSPPPPSDYFEAGSMIVVSERLKALLIDAKVRAEFIPLRVSLDGSEYTTGEFFFCHTLDCVDCFDYQMSDFSYHTKPGFTDRINSIDRLTIDEDKAASHVLFRLTNGADDIVLVSDSLAAILSDSGFTGMKLLSPDEWYFGC